MGGGGRVLSSERALEEVQEAEPLGCRVLAVSLPQMAKDTQNTVGKCSD